jgi:1,4-alpha-glucan branching enzyme
MPKPTPQPIHEPATDAEKIVAAVHSQPHSYLGMHKADQGTAKGVVVRAFVPDAAECEVVALSTKRSHPMKQIDTAGLFEVFLPRRKDVFKYQLRVTYPDGTVRQFWDPYSFLPTISEHDLYLFNEGTEHFIYKKLGAHTRTIDGVDGVTFAVWAPSATRVSVVGNFNHWNGRAHPMRPLGASGVWEVFIPGLGDGELYKYEIRDGTGAILIKTDPFGTYFEGPPNNASIVHNTRNYTWRDGEWIARRASGEAIDRPISVYEVHAGSWRRSDEGERLLSYRELAHQLAEYVVEMGFTHVEVMPLAEHPFTGSWGYQVTGFFAPTHRHGTPDDFMYFVDVMHEHGIGVIVDWVPAHFPRDSFALARFDGTCLFEHEDPRKGAHQDWGTLIFNYGRHEVKAFLAANALAWIDRFHIDGLRVDAVASMLYLDYSRKEGEWIPNQHGGRENLEAISFLQHTNDLVHQYYPGVLMIAEESTSWGGVTKPTSGGGLGFDLKWNMGWMHDTLRYFSKEPIHRKWHTNDLTFGMLYQYSENFVSVFSHDEVVHGKGSMLMKMGSWHIPEKAATLRALYAHTWAYPGKKLLFMGSEFGQSGEWRYDAALDWHLLQYLDHEGIRVLVRDLNRLYRGEPLLGQNDFNPQGFQWVACWDSSSSVISYVRQSQSTDDCIFVVCNFTAVIRQKYRIGVPRSGWWRELLNTDATIYGGTGAGNLGGVSAQDIAWDNFHHSLELTLPPMSTLIFKSTREG